MKVVYTGLIEIMFSVLKKRKGAVGGQAHKEH